MVARLGISRATKHFQRRCLHTQDLVSTGVVRIRKVPTKGNLAELHTKLLPAEQTVISVRTSIYNQPPCTPISKPSCSTIAMPCSRILVA